MLLLQGHAQVIVRLCTNDTMKRANGQMMTDSLSPISFIKDIYHVNGVCTVLIDSTKSHRYSRYPRYFIFMNTPLAREVFLTHRE